MGTFESDSAPPAMAMSAWPSMIWSAASVMAWFAEAHARLTLHAWRFFGKSGISATSRAMFGASTFGTTLPNTSRSAVFGSTPDRWTSSPTAILPSSMALRCLRSVPAFAKGVRTPAMMATRRRFPDMTISLKARLCCSSMGNPSTPAAHSWRDRTRERLVRDFFDVLVIGGALRGAGIARAPALRGLSVALVERDDFASGTSSRSSRLVHGGVRYLEHGYFHLVFESSRERRILLETAPHLVRPLQFTWPVYRAARIPRWKLNAGLWLYDLLAAFQNVERHRSLSASPVLDLEPKLRRDGLKGGATYFDAATNDARLTIANVIDAFAAGAAALNYAEVTSLTFECGRG